MNSFNERYGDELKDKQVDNVKNVDVDNANCCKASIVTKTSEEKASTSAFF